LAQNHPGIESDGEMQGDSALSQITRQHTLPHSRLEGVANVLIMPNLDAANIAYQMIKMLADALLVGPILIGPSRPAHILTPSVTARGILNMTAVAVSKRKKRQADSSRICLLKTGDALWYGLPRRTRAGRAE